MRTRAKMHVSSVTEYQGGSKQVKLMAVYSSEGENKDFADATPSGNLDLTINAGRPAADAFTPGQQVYVDITPVDEVKAQESAG